MQLSCTGFPSKVERDRRPGLGRSMICELVGLPAAIDPATATVILSDRLLGVNGSPATLWRSADPRVRFGIVVNLGVAC